MTQHPTIRQRARQEGFTLVEVTIILLVLVILSRSSCRSLAASIASPGMPA